MKNSYIVGAIVTIAIIGLAVWLLKYNPTPLVPGDGTTSTATSTLPSETYGMNQYIDSTYGFSFWYPKELSVVASTTQDSKNFPGGISVETLLIGPQGDTSIFVVNSPQSTLTDEPSGHASPIAQTKYFYGTVSKKWMVAFPDSASEGSAHATTTADVSQTTISGLPMLKSGRRFNTTIIPLSTTRFLIVTDSGGSSFTSQLARTVAQTGVTVDLSKQTTALQAEAAAYANR